MPCCMSTTRESQPAWAITSAEKLLGMPHQLLITGFPAAHNSRTRLARAIRSSSCSAQTRPIPPAGAGEVKDLPEISPWGVPGYFPDSNANRVLIPGFDRLIPGSAYQHSRFAELGNLSASL